MMQTLPLPLVGDIVMRRPELTAPATMQSLPPPPLSVMLDVAVMALTIRSAPVVPVKLAVAEVARRTEVGATPLLAHSAGCSVAAVIAADELPTLDAATLFEAVKASFPRPPTATSRTAERARMRRSFTPPLCQTPVRGRTNRGMKQE